MRRLWNWIKSLFAKRKPIVYEQQLEPVSDFVPSKYREMYGDLWRTMKVKPDKKSTVQWYVKKIKENMPRYEEVSKESGVPWELIGCLHLMEGSGDFSRVLHNGESLTSV